MQLARVSLSLSAAIAVISAVVAGAVIWLMLTNPVTVADAVNEGAVTPFVRELASVLYQAFSGLLKYL
jgi:hypothetical protein